MSILVTGATGFIGQYLISHLSEKDPSLRVHSVGKTELPGRGALHHQCDLTDPNRVQELIQQVKPDQIYHLSGISRVSDKIEIRNYFIQNSLTTQILLESLHALNKPIHFFLASSVHVYGNQHGVITEKSELNPESPYGFSKYLAEETLKAATQKNKNIKAIVGRLYSCFGPKQPKGFVAADVCEKIRLLPKNQVGVLQVGPIDTFRRFLDVRDAVRIFPILVEKNPEAHFEIYNIASPHEITIGRMIELLLKIAGASARLESSGSSANMFKGLRVDISRLEKLIPSDVFRPLEVSLRDMLASG